MPTHPTRPFWQRLPFLPSPPSPSSSASLSPHPPIPPEDSIPLRILVQLMAAIGIIATDVAAADVTTWLGLSLWAIPASAIGSVWSWYRRRSRNIPTKFCIAIAMLIALGGFLMRLVARQDDTRLLLAELLIQLQVFHSFDLPRRKDLGYSAVIGLILLGVAATVSQTVLFGGLLVAFVAAAIPMLILDYRSRLGLDSRRFAQVKWDLSGWQISWLLTGVVGLGLVFFLLFPRFPGYQLRSFPVSAPIGFSGEFQPESIMNPDYESGFGTGTGNGAGTQGGGSRNQPGAIDPDSYYGFSSRMNQNLRGAMTPKVVMRVRSQAPGFWRVLAFDRYTGQGWEMSRNDRQSVEIVQRPTWSFRFDLPGLLNSSRRREVVQTYTIVDDLPNLIPTLYAAKELYFPTTQIGRDLEEGLRSPVPLTAGLTYSVVSEVPYRDRTLLRDAPEIELSVNQPYLQMPEALRAKLRTWTLEILAKSPTPITAASEKALYLAQYLKQNFRIQPDMPFLAADEDLVEAFLFKYQGGYGDHFSTALTMMLRSIEIPARLVVGFGTGQFNPFTGFYEVRNTDAFAMTEVYFHRFGWLTFNPIPGYPLVPESIEDSQVFGALQQFWQWIAGLLPSPIAGWLNGLLTLVGGALGWIVRLLTSGWMGLIAGLLGGTVLGFLGWLGWRGWVMWRDRRRLAQLPPMEAIYQQMLAGLGEQGKPKSPAQTPLEYAEVYLRAGDRAEELGTELGMDLGAIVQEISQAYVRWRYGGEEPDLMRLQRQLRVLREKVRRPAFLR